MNPLAAQAANLGVDYQNSSINDLADSSMKRLQETGDLSLASDQSYLDKMKLMQQGAFGALKTGSLQEKADAQLQYQMYLANLAAQAAAAKSGGGGGGSKKKGGGGGGGSGGSGGVKGTATQTGTSIDTGIPGLINSLYASGQNDLANNVGRYYDIYNEGALSAAMKDATSFTPTKQKKVTQNLSFFNKKVMDKYKKQAATNVANRKGTTFINTAAQVANALRPNTKQYGGVIYNNKVTRSAKGF
jgi:hypothetical protein